MDIFLLETQITTYNANLSLFFVKSDGLSRRVFFGSAFCLLFVVSFQNNAMEGIGKYRLLYVLKILTLF